MSIASARAAVRSSLMAALFADLASEASARVLSGSTEEVAEMLRRNNPEWNIAVTAEQKQRTSWGGQAYGPNGVMTPVGDPQMAQSVADTQERDRLRRTVG